MRLGETIFCTKRRRCWACFLGFLLILSCALLFLPYFSFIPCIPIFPCIDPTNITQFRDYYGVIFALLSFEISAIAVLLGGCYYIDKNRIDEYRKKEDKKELLIQNLLSTHKEFEKSVLCYLSLRGKDDSTVSRAMEDVRTKDEYFETILEDAKRKLGDNIDISKFLISNQYIDKSPAMDKSKFKDMTDCDVYTIQENFNDRNKMVRTMIYAINDIDPL